MNVLPVFDNRLQKLINAYSYADLGEKKVFIPAGMQVPYLTYLEVLEGAIEVNQELLTLVLVPYARWLGELIEEPERLKSIGGSRAIAAFKPHNLDELTAKLGLCFKMGDNQTQKSFKEVFARNADLKPVYSTATALISRYKSIDRKKVNATVRGISDMLSVLITNIDEKNISLDHNPTGRDYLATLTRSLAREIEFYALMGYQLTQLAVALKNTSKTL
jgi:hypothetical protein